MPEGHLIHHFADRIRADLGGAEVRATSPQGRFDAGVVDGRRLLDVRAAGKHLFYDVEDAPAVHVHLGMRGLFLHHPDPATPPRTGTRLRLAGPTAAWDLIAPSACDLLDPAEVARILAKLGPDPLGPDDPTAAVTALRSFRGPVGAALLDQSVWAGVGNAWRAELLFLARLHPRTPCADLSVDQATALWGLTRRLMALGRDAGQVVSDPSAPDERWVYKRASCRSCGAAVATAAITGRIAHWCPVEQHEQVHALHTR
ncbi:Fpg/Nei family DNA glycosylase [Sporichthya polymorpha]|uniref:Fpg/Nei family DNA glycosylase n=1 Tax=Sporichthya polymorpha TaxID=35751 RepID=UPI00037ED346|nr:DNA-formamidopyrimidine glycosylase family protein [Sporichthya polymorpha]